MQGWRIKHKETGQYYASGRWSKYGKVYFRKSDLQQALDHIQGTGYYKRVPKPPIEVIEVLITEIGPGEV